MNDERETRIAERLRAARMPAAPEELHALLRDLERSTAPARPVWGRRLALGAPLALLAVVAIAANVLAPGSAPATSGPAPTVGASSAPSTPTTGVFEAPGIRFTHPPSWVSVGTPPAWTDTWGRRDVGYLADASAACYEGRSPAPFSTDDPCTAGEDGLRPGALYLLVREHLHPVPGESLFGRPTIHESDRVFRSSDGWYWATDPGGGIYQLVFSVPYGEYNARADEFQQVVDSLVFTDWPRSAPTVVDGWTKLGPEGGMFQYPAGWEAYRFTPLTYARYSQPVMVFASTPLEPCTAPATCHLEDPPDDAIVIQTFVTSSPIGRTDWENDANATIDGHRAIRTIPVLRDGVERQSWSIQLDRDDYRTLDLEVAITAIDDQNIREALSDFLARIDIPEEPSGPGR